MGVQHRKQLGVNIPNQALFNGMERVSPFQGTGEVSGTHPVQVFSGVLHGGVTGIIQPRGTMADIEIGLVVRQREAGMKRTEDFGGGPVWFSSAGVV